jgi:hypothetical protein
MENKSNIEIFSAYNRVCQKFLSFCEEESVDPVICLQAMNRFFGLTTPVAVATGVAPTEQPKTPVPSLTKEEAKRVKEVARAQKAKGKGLKASEVNLTSKEAQDAKAAARKALSQGKSLDDYLGKLPTTAAPGAIKDSLGSSPSSNSKKVLKPNRKVDSQKDGLRSTAITKFKGCRKSCLQTQITAVNDPRILHLVAYNNHCVRLSNQWDAFCQAYEQDGLRSPLRGLPFIPKLSKCNEQMKSVVGLLREHKETPGTYILQNLEGQSFWTGDKPSVVCPQELLAGIPEQCLSEFAEAQLSN